MAFLAIAAVAAAVVIGIVAVRCGARWTNAFGILASALGGLILIGGGIADMVVSGSRSWMLIVCGALFLALAVVRMTQQPGGPEATGS